MTAAAPGSAEPATRLARRIGLPGAVGIGLGSMLGAGVFAALGPAAAAAGSALLVSLLVAAVIAYANATSTARLAAVMPVSGGAYAFGRARLGHGWGYLAGWAFVVGKLASCAAMAWTFGAYLAPAHARPLAVGLVVLVCGVNLAGVRKTATATWWLVSVVLAVLAYVVVLGLAAEPAGQLAAQGDPVGWYGVAQAAGILFFAFAGYARVATLGEEVRAPARTIPRAVRISLAGVLVVYLAVALAALRSVGADGLAAAQAPLAAVAEAAGAPVAPVAVGAALACAGVLLSLLAGIGRTVFAMADEGDLPRRLAVVSPRTRVPHVAMVAASAVVVAVVLVADVRGAIGFSSFAVLVYYAVANAAAWTLEGPGARLGRVVSAVGFTGCVVVACCLPLASVVAGVAVVAMGVLAWVLTRALGGGSGRTRTLPG